MEYVSIATFYVNKNPDLIPGFFHARSMIDFNFLKIDNGNTAYWLINNKGILHTQYQCEQKTLNIAYYSVFNF